MHNLTYQERARFAYAAGNDELAEALEKCAEQEAENEELTDRVWDLEQELDELRKALTNIVEDWQYAGCPTLDGHIGIKHLKAAEEIL